jgi:hypothetical protein
MRAVYYGRMRYALLTCLACLLLSACASEETKQRKLLEDIARRPVTCSVGADCDQKWNRAIAWVTQHSKMGIRTINDSLIEANMVAAEDTKPVLKYPEFSVVRYKHGDIYVMEFSTYCDEGFVCVPSGLKLRASFVTYIMGPPPGMVIKGLD